MAPEVIEQSGATTASDIWSVRLPRAWRFESTNGHLFNLTLHFRSVGCTVIELLEGKPPYHFLDPMPALFRIVQDDCPPIPEGASPIVKDFLYRCFQKDCNLRISAKKLLRHPWMASARKHMTRSSQDDVTEGGRPVGGSGSGSAGAGTGAGTGAERRPLSNYNFDEAVLKVQEWNEALKCEFSLSLPWDILSLKCSLNDHSGNPLAPSRPSKNPERRRTVHESMDDALARSTSPPLPPAPSNLLSLSQTPKGPGIQKPRVLPSNGKAAQNGSKTHVAGSALPMPFILQQPEEQTDNWDDDFEEGISLTKLQGKGYVPLLMMMMV